MPKRRQHAFIECKTFGHAWDEYNPGDGDLNGWFDRITLRCERCGSTRHDYHDNRGELGARKYWTPDGYKDAKDQKPSRAALRLMLHGHSTRGVK
jgi:hypothetical protein